MITHTYTQSANIWGEVREQREVGEHSLDFHTYGHITELVDLT